MFSRFVFWALGANLTSVLADRNDITVFAPNNAAFDNLGTEQFESLSQDEAALRNIVRYHIVPMRLEASELMDGQRLQTLRGFSLRVSVSGGVVTINGAPVVQTNINAENGILHVLGDVLLPPVSTTTTTTTTTSTSTTTTTTTTSTTTLFDTLLTGLTSSFDFSTLVFLTVAAEVDDDLNGSGPLTLFAPTNEAIGSLSSTVVQLLLSDRPFLAYLLGYHVVPGIVDLDSLQDGDMLQTLSGPRLLVQRVNGQVVLDGVAVVDASGAIRADNGVAFPLSAVLTPPAQTTVIGGSSSSSTTTTWASQAPSASRRASSTTDASPTCRSPTMRSAASSSSTAAARWARSCSTAS